MENEHVLSGLMRKRSEIAGQIEYTQRALNELIIDLDHIDHTIRLIDPNADVTLGKPKQFPPRHAAFKNEMSRFVMAALRRAKEPVTSLEVAKEVVIARGLDVTDSRTVSLIRKRVGERASFGGE
jgi:hypothetical protein